MSQATAAISTILVTDLMALAGDILVLSMNVPVLPSSTIFKTFKTSQRHVFAHAIVNLGGCITMSETGLTGTVTAARLVVGGATATLHNAASTAKLLVGAKLNQATYAVAAKALAAEIAASPSTDPRHSLAYRQNLATGFLYKLFLSAQGSSLPTELTSAIVPFVPADARPVSTGTEVYGDGSTSAGGSNADAPIHEYIPKMDARIQASGEARYVIESCLEFMENSRVLFAQRITV